MCYSAPSRRTADPQPPTTRLLESTSHRRYLSRYCFRVFFGGHVNWAGPAHLPRIWDAQVLDIIVKYDLWYNVVMEDVLDVFAISLLVIWMGQADAEIAPALWTLVLLSAAIMYALGEPTRELTQEERDEWFGGQD